LSNIFTSNKFGSYQLLNILAQSHAAVMNGNAPYDLQVLLS